MGERLQLQILGLLELFSDQASADWTVCGTFRGEFRSLSGNAFSRDGGKLAECADHRMRAGQWRWFSAHAERRLHTSYPRGVKLGHDIRQKQNL